MPFGKIYKNVHFIRRYAKTLVFSCCISVGSTGHRTRTAENKGNQINRERLITVSCLSFTALVVKRCMWINWLFTAETEVIKSESVGKLVTETAAGTSVPLLADDSRASRSNSRSAQKTKHEFCLKNLLERPQSTDEPAVSAAGTSRLLLRGGLPVSSPRPAAGRGPSAPPQPPPASSPRPARPGPARRCEPPRTATWRGTAGRAPRYLPPKGLLAALGGSPTAPPCPGAVAGVGVRGASSPRLHYVTRSAAAVEGEV
nr:uncharacterized protein LOC113845091 isoform X2 [Anas platyrhynchos]